MKTERVKYAMGFLLLLIVEVFIALFVHDSFVRPYIGDVLVVVVLYFFIRIFIPSGAKWMPLYIFLFALGIEILQYLRILEKFGLQKYVFLKIVIGSVFDVKDIICYAIGCVAIGLVSKSLKK